MSTSAVSEPQVEEQRLAMQRAQEATMKIRDDFIADARRELDLAATTIRTHLKSLAAALGASDDRAVAESRAKVTTLEWSLDRITRSMDRIVALADEASRRLSGSPK